MTYNVLKDFLLPSNFSQPLIHHTSINNLFFNTTLAGTVFSNIGLNDTALVDAITIPNWAAMKPPKFRWNYLCNQRQLKPTLHLIVSVFGLALSLLHSIYAVFLMLFGLILRTLGLGNWKQNREAARPDQHENNRPIGFWFERLGRGIVKVCRRGFANANEPPLDGDELNELEPHKNAPEEHRPIRRMDTESGKGTAPPIRIVSLSDDQDIPSSPSTSIQRHDGERVLRRGTADEA